MIPYIGDVSINDAFVLKGIAEESDNILEFGVGASTQILRHYSKGKMISVDTMQEWIDRTKKNFKLVGVKGDVDFRLYDEDYSGKYDFIFVDGHKRLRYEFGVNNWKHLAYGGFMAFHDTRKEFHIDYVCDLLKRHYLQVESVQVNPSESNLTIIKKRKALKYVNWNQTENRPSWQYGRGQFDMDEFLIYKEKQNKK